MYKQDVERGGLYLAKVNGALTVVRVLEACLLRKGWTARNCKTGRTVRITSARRFRRVVSTMEMELLLGGY